MTKVTGVKRTGFTELWKGAWSSYSSASLVSCHAALTSCGSPRLGAVIGVILRVCLKEYLLLVLMGRERATLF